MGYYFGLILKIGVNSKIILMNFKRKSTFLNSTVSFWWARGWRSLIVFFKFGHVFAHKISCFLLDPLIAFKIFHFTSVFKFTSQYHMGQLKKNENNSYLLVIGWTWALLGKNPKLSNPTLFRQNFNFPGSEPEASTHTVGKNATFLVIHKSPLFGQNSSMSNGSMHKKNYKKL